jgi:hypothetical protein
MREGSRSLPGCGTFIPVPADGVAIFLGGLPRCGSTGIRTLLQEVGAPEPSAVVLLPVKVQSRTAAKVLYPSEEEAQTAMAAVRKYDWPKGTTRPRAEMYKERAPGPPSQPERREERKDKEGGSGDRRNRPHPRSKRGGGLVCTTVNVYKR